MSASTILSLPSLLRGNSESSRSFDVFEMAERRTSRTQFSARLDVMTDILHEQTEMLRPGSISLVT